MTPFHSLCFLLATCLFACSQGGPVQVGGVEVPPGLMAVADEAAFDYTGHLHKALENNNLALSLLFAFSEKTDSVIAGQHGRALADLLARKGDEAFSQQLSQQPAAVRRSVWRAFGEAKLPSPLKANAPLTWKALMPEGEAQEAQGLYLPGEKFDTYLHCSRPGVRLVAVDETGAIPKNYKRLLPRAYPAQAIYAEVKGHFSEYYAATRLPGNCTGFFIITEIIELEAKNSRNTCIPYDYWASGTEPFWSAQISAGEGLIEFYDPSEEKFTTFPYSTPLQTDTAKVYAAFNQSTGDNIRISVKKTACSDGMSDIRHDYEVRLTMNGKQFSGCGIDFERGRSDD